MADADDKSAVDATDRLGHSQAEKRAWFTALCPITNLPWKVVIFGVLEAAMLIGFVATPTFLMVKNVELWSNPLTQFFFQLLSTFLSVLVGWQLSRYPNERKGTAKWLPTARTACDQLLTMWDQVSRLRSTNRTTCDEVRPLLQPVNEVNRQAIESVIAARCRSCKESLYNLENQVETTLRVWVNFVEDNCDKDGECPAFKREFKARSDELQRKRPPDPGTQPQTATSMLSA